MDIQAIGAAATVAFFCTIVFLVAAKSWQLLNRMIGATPSFADDISSEAAQRFRDELNIVSRKQSTYLAAILVFALVYSTVSLFISPRLYPGYPVWQLYILLAALLAAAGLAAYRLGVTTRHRRHVRFLQDANIAIGHQLHRIAADHGRAYHDVPTAAGIIDHLLVGQSGIYAINVIARRPYRQASVSLDHNELQFSQDQCPLSLVATTSASKRLARDLRELTNEPVRVRSVIAVPGWDIRQQASEDHLLVNVQTLPMIRGWKDQGDYLMDDAVAAIHHEVTRRCKRASDRLLPRRVSQTGVA